MSFVFKVGHPQFVFFGLQIPASLTDQCTTPMKNGTLMLLDRVGVDRVTVEQNLDFGEINLKERLYLIYLTAQYPLN